MLTQLLQTSINNFAKVGKSNKPRTLKQRLKYYGRHPEIFKLKTRIRPPDLTDPNIVFPIRIPIRYRHVLHLKK